MSDFQSSSNWILASCQPYRVVSGWNFREYKQSLQNYVLNLCDGSVQSFGRFCTFRKDNDNKANDTFSYFIVVFWITT